MVKDLNTNENLNTNEAKEAVAYRASYEEADDRMKFSIHQLYKKYTINSPFIKNSLSIIVVTPDTDIFVVLMFNMKNTWKDLGLYLLKKKQIIMPQKLLQRLYPLHILLSKLYPKRRTKKNLLNISNSFDPLITDFGREALDYDMLQQAEQFLINVITKISIL